MDFFESQESLTALEWVLRSIVSFVFLLLATKLMGQRSISQLRFLDFAIALILGNILAHPLSDERLGLKGSMITTLVLVILYIATTGLSLKWSFLKRFLDPAPLTLIKNGEIQYHNLPIAKISVEYLFSELRREKVEDIRKVALVLWEPGGTLSIFLNPQYQPLTAADMNIKTQPFNLIRPIICDGKPDLLLLKELGKDLTWLSKMVAPTHSEISEVSLATVDINGNVRIYSNSIHDRFQ